MSKTKTQISPSDWAAVEIENLGKYGFRPVCAASAKTLRKAATRMRQIEKFFAQHPNAWLQGDEIVKTESDIQAATGEAFQVCFAGAMRNAKKIGLKLDPLNHVPKQEIESLTDVVIRSNDKAPSLEHFRMFLRHFADLLEQYAAVVPPKVRDRVEASPVWLKMGPNWVNLDPVWVKMTEHKATQLRKRHLQVKAYKDRNKVIAQGVKADKTLKGLGKKSLVESGK